MLRSLVRSSRSLRLSSAAVAVSGLSLIGLSQYPTLRRSFSAGAEQDRDRGNNTASSTLRVAGAVVSAEEKAANDLLWEEKAKSCPLCRLFLESPCAEEFKQFSDCADRAKESGEEVSTLCGPGDFARMRKCMELYPEHFELLFEAEEGIVADDEEDDEGVKESSELAPPSAEASSRHSSKS
mmetsp:Transcript_34941/g.65196  ORF Transcript_34941/g.65196 Transcript_34941/m.65196 type:complete len:182 (+) Transcript_34941:165-710(+)